MIEITSDPARVIIPINEKLINKTIYIASKVRNDVNSYDVVAFAVKRKHGWTWIFATPDSHAGKFYPILTNIHDMLSREFNDFREQDGEITILENSQELQTYLQRYGINSIFQKLLECTWDAL